MTIRFDNKSAIVTGAGVGLGKAHAILLAARGAQVIVNDLDADAVEAVVGEITAAGGTAIGCVASVSEADSAAGIVESAISNFGKIDILVNNAGILRDKSFKKMTLEDFELVLQVHLLGTTYMTKAAWQPMLDQKYGRILFTSSASGLATSFGQANYGAAKAGMLGLMNNLKNEGVRDNVLVNIIAPVAATQMTDGILGERLMKISLPEHVSAAVGVLVSEDCTLTGKMFAVGAGHFAQIEMMKAPGVTFDPSQAPTLEAVAGRMDDIMNMNDAAPYNGIFDAKTKAILGV